MCIRQLGLSLVRANFHDVVNRIADLLGGFLFGDLPVFILHRDGVLDLALFAFLDDFLFTRFQIRVDTHLDLERGLFDPLNRFSSRRALGAHADDLLDRLLGALSGHGRVAVWLAVLDLLGRSHNVSAQLTGLVYNLLTLF